MGLLIGLDIGGTSVKAVAVRDGAEIVARRTIAAGGAIPQAELIRIVSACARDVSEGATPNAAGLAFGGMIQPGGVMREGSTNLPNLAGPPLRALFSDALGLPCRIDNDAMAAMRGEAALGAARGMRNAMTLTFGSGIGSGLLLDGRIHRGAHGRAGEIGLWRLHSPPSAGEWLPLEELAAPGRLASRRGIAFADLLKDAPNIEPVFEAIGRAIANAHLLADLEAVIIIGGVTALGEPLRAAIEASYRAACATDFQHGLQIKYGELGAYAGAAGAAALWFDGETE